MVVYKVLALDSADQQQLDAAEAVIFVWEVEQSETFKLIQGLVRDEEEEGPDRVQLCVAVGADSEQLDGAREWCIDHGYEFLCCPLGGDDLQSLKERSSAGDRRTGLLDDVPENSILRLMEALECHSSWSSLTAKKPAAAIAVEPEQQQPAKRAETNGYTPLPDAPKAKCDVSKPTGMEKVHDRIQDEDLAEADEFEKLAHEMKEVRAMEDHAARRDRACDLAMRLASALGVDSDSD
ncbi:unnamed protein product [Effrenium voratum]|nr:unnamed protein product [Effrenium voratum]